MVYFIQNTNTKAVKIGMSEDPHRRIAGLQAAVPDPLELLGLIPGGRAIERRLHGRFSDYRLRGEWFRGDPDFLDAVSAIVYIVENRQTVMKAVADHSGSTVGLIGLYVALPGDEATSQVVGLIWTSSEEILLTLDDTRQVYASKTYLISPWPEDFKAADCGPLALYWKETPIVALDAYAAPSSMTNQEFASILGEALQFIGRRICHAQKRDNKNGEIWIECNPSTHVPDVNYDNTN